MIDRSRVVRVGTRGSALARWQTDYIAGLLRTAWDGLEIEIQLFHTQGDRVLDTPLPLIGGKGVFTEELEAALRAGEIDMAVHSLKDLPTENPPGLTIGATPERADPRDALISRSGLPLAALPENATLGTSSRRRAAQLLYARPDLRTADIRGNVDTRIRKALDPGGPYDAILLAAAGLNRLGQGDVVTEYLGLDVMLPAPGQAAIAVQCRDEAASLALLAPLDHPATRLAVTAERTFLAGLGGGCALPIAAYATVSDGRLHLHGRVGAPDGSKRVDVSADDEATLQGAERLGRGLAASALAQGAAALLEISS